MELHELIEQGLQRYDSFYDPAACALQVAWQGGGYHTHAVNGQLVHPTRETLDYPILLLASGTPEHVRRAGDIIAKIMTFQDRNPCSPTYGIWPYLCEESLEEMSPPDWNWADFCGIRLAHMLGAYESLLAPDLRAEMLVAVEAAAYSIFRRNVGPGYTNIAVKGAIVSGLVGEKTGNQFLLDYAARRLEAFIDSVRCNGGFNEYNSPNYGILVLREVERGLLLLKGEKLANLMRAVHYLLWDLFSHSIHLATGQISGPQSRAYQDILPIDIAQDLEERLDYPLFAPSSRPAEGILLSGALPEPLFLVPTIPCPADIRERIVGQATGFARHTYVRSEDPDALRVASIWKTADLCLGSINYDNLWIQRRPVMGHWRVGDDVAILRVRMKTDGVDFASGAIRTVQEEGSLLSVVSFTTNKGDYHDHLDHPAAGTFDISHLELSIELEIPGATVESRDGGGFILSAGPWSAHVHPLLARFGNFSVNWESRVSDQGVQVRALINEGNSFTLDPRTVGECVIAFALTVLPAGQPLPEVPASARIDGHDILVKRNDGSLSLKAPTIPHPVRDHFTK